MRYFLALLIFIVPPWAAAQQELSAAQQARYNVLVAELRCVVCQNQNLAESSVPLAKDLKATVREQLIAGKSNRQIKDYLVTRYGEFVLYRPRLSLRTLFLWVVPPLLFIAGLIAILRARRRSKPQALDNDEQQRLEQLLNANREK